MAESLNDFLKDSQSFQASRLLLCVFLLSFARLLELHKTGLYLKNQVNHISIFCSVQQLKITCSLFTDRFFFPILAWNLALSIWRLKTAGSVAI